ncbi:MAG: cytochrome c oxidase assembly protein [Rhodospirillales bacterium]|nr:cytochrome c oxidase assembly protein [Rhodospirillales bacterium]
MSDKAGRDRKKARSAVVLFAIAGGMVGLSFASVPLYRAFCQATGYGGTPRTENVTAPTTITDRRVTVQFDANVNPELPWRFKPVQRSVDVRLGEETLIHYTATNLSDRPLTGTATFNVSPDAAAQYFSKIQCFCFTEQTLAPGQEVSMPVLFYVDPAIAADADARDISTITLSYTFYRTNGDDKNNANSAGVAARSARGGNG